MRDPHRADPRGSAERARRSAGAAIIDAAYVTRSASAERASASRRHRGIARSDAAPPARAWDPPGSSTVFTRISEKMCDECEARDGTQGPPQEPHAAKPLGSAVRSTEREGRRVAGGRETSARWPTMVPQRLSVRSGKGYI